MIATSLSASKYALLVLLQLLLLYMVWQTEQGAGEPPKAADPALVTDDVEEAVK